MHSQSSTAALRAIMPTCEHALAMGFWGAVESPEPRAGSGERQQCSKEGDWQKRSESALVDNLMEAVFPE